ncbi:DUF6624 domain-containing protein [Mucilaginibacter sp.]|uniref:DUF6624 domain-containing protein n=1 Tax=Mucilaginibacter sp. TaxID=1882438 RepID=UPI00284FD02F|nr:DUF6624 domain-containing protein [Mucilaginibacter sp.]MDR3697442.1 hypothetical protein [Mucilaginibacter sp.]
MLFYLKKLTLFACLFSICFAVNGQANKPGTASIKAADSLYNLKRFKQASKCYFICFQQNAFSKTNSNLFNAAKACAQTRYIDSAYNFLFAVVRQHGRDYYSRIISEPVFKKLHPGKRWISLKAMIDEQQNNANTNKIVGDEFIALRMNRVALEERKSNLARQYSISSKKVRRLNDSINMIDSINCYKWKSIINTYGWLGYSAIGIEGVEGELCIYQNANITFQKIHFPVIAEAFKRGALDAYDYAVIADRISLYDTGKQIYGTQVKPKGSTATALFPVENNDSLNIRRQLIGLKPIP